MTFVRDFKREHAERDQARLKRLRAAQWEREKADARAAGVTVYRLRRLRAEARRAS